MRVDLTTEEVREVHDLLVFVCRRSPGTNKRLEAVIRKLGKVGSPKVCVHCRSRLSRRKDQVCDPCNTYRHDRGELPPHAVLTRRESVTPST